MDVVAIILAGGIGKRLKPLSSAEKPKQFHRLLGKQTLLQATYERIAGWIPSERILIFTQSSFVPFVKEQLPQITPENILVEPLMKDTAGAITFATLLCQKRYGNPTLMFFPADHGIDSKDKFKQVMQSAAKNALENLYLVGVIPDHPATQYGYLHCGASIAVDQGIEHFRLLDFHEKPNAEKAQMLLSQGDYLWNAGILIGKARTIQQEISQHLPEHLDKFNPVFVGAIPDPTKLEQAFQGLTSVSFDYGVLEKSKHLSIVEANFSWSDLGSWEALEKYLGKSRDIILKESGYVESN